jgi:hypothetical protein
MKMPLRISPAGRKSPAQGRQKPTVSQFRNMKRGKIKNNRSEKVSTMIPVWNKRENSSGRCSA